MPLAQAFGGAVGGSRFVQEYARGALPCRIDHGTCSYRISWDVSVEEVVRRRGDLLVLCAEGLRQAQHPYSTLARLAFADLAARRGCEALSEGEIKSTMAHLRCALLAGGDAPAGAARAIGGGASGGGKDDIFVGALAALRQLVCAEGAALAASVHLVLPAIAKRMHAKAHKQRIHEALVDLEDHGGPEVARLLRSRGLVAAAVA